MENKQEKIVFIDRKKSTPIFQSNLEKLQKYFIAKNYKDEKILFRVIYDKIYRPELYNFILKGGKKNLNLARNIYTANEDRYEFQILKSNDDFKIDDDELYSENNYISKLHKYFILHKLSIYLSVPLGCSSIYFKLVKKSSFYFNITILVSVTLLLVSLSNYRTKEKFYTSEIHKILENANVNDADAYKKFYYD